MLHRRMMIRLTVRCLIAFVTKVTITYIILMNCLSSYINQLLCRVYKRSYKQKNTEVLSNSYLHVVS